MKFNINNKNNQGMITLIEAVAVVCIFGLASIMAVTYFGNKAAEARAEIRHADVKATVSKPVPKAKVAKPEAVVLQERLDERVAALAAITDKATEEPSDADKALKISKEITEIKKLQAMATTPAATAQPQQTKK